MSTKLTYVYNVSDLEIVIDFLQGGFGWSSKRSDEIKRHFNKQTSTVPMAAYQEEAGELKIAILLFNQSKYLGNKDRTLSLSSWYAVPESRGISVINFARLLLRDLNGFTLTIYSPILQVYTLLKGLGFEDMRVRHIQLGLTKNFPFFKFSKVGDVFNYSYLKNATFLSLGNEKSVETTGGSTIHYRLRQVRVKNKFFRLRIGDFYIEEEDKGRISFWSLLQFSLRHKCIQINLHVKSSDQSKKSVAQLKKYRWLVKNHKISGQYVAPAGSEWCIITGMPLDSGTAYQRYCRRDKLSSSKY